MIVSDLLTILRLSTMHVYKVIYAKNEIISCNKIEDSLSLITSYHYEHEKGQLIYALIKAADVEDALKIANEIILEVTASKPKDHYFDKLTLICLADLLLS